VARYDRASLREHCDALHPFGQSEQVRIEPVEFASPETTSAEFSKIAGTYELEQPYVAEIRDAYVLDGAGVCTTDDFTILVETANSREDKLPLYFEEHRMEIFELLKRQRTGRLGRAEPAHVDFAVSLISAPYEEGGAYYSTKWIQSYLTRLQGLRHYMEETGERPTLLLEPDPQPYKTESLQLLGFGPEDVVYWNPDRPLRVDRLVVPSVRRSERLTDFQKGEEGVTYKLLSPDACHWLRREVRSVIGDGTEFSNDVFISREDAPTRNITNREEVLTELRDRGFEKYVLSELSFQEQATLFAQADRVVSPHGAGLTNSMFAEDCEIFEIFGAKVKPTFYMQSQVLGLEYTALLEQPVGDDIRVDVDTLTSALDE